VEIYCISPETFNNFFINVAKDIGSKDINIDNNHPSIKTIINNKTENRICWVILIGTVAG
jgi:hypothetical protein